MYRFVYSASVASVLLLAGCLDPLVDDTPGFSEHIRPSPEGLPSMTDNAALSAQVDANDGVNGNVVALRRGFAEGQEVRFWDFGPAPDFAIPVWLLRQCDENGMPTAPIPNHPNVIDAVPGDFGYSPFWSMVIVCVTDAYQNETFASSRALADGVEVGLLQPFQDTGKWANCPVVLPSVGLEIGNGQPNYPPHDGYYRDTVSYYFHLGGMDRGVYDLDAQGLVEKHYVFQATDEEGRSCDPVFEVTRTSPDYSPLWQVVEVDSSECFADWRSVLRKESETFVALSGTIRSVRVTEELVNLGIQAELGLP